MTTPNENGLTEKQQRFVDEYLLDLNIRQAATRAGYSEKTAPSIGNRLLKNPKVKAEIDRRIRERSERTQIDSDWVLKRLALEADADLGDLFDEDGNLRPMQEWPKIWRMGLVTGLDVVAVKGTGVITKVKLSDRVKRIELIGKHTDVQAFRDSLTIGGDKDNPLLHKIERTVVDPKGGAGE